MVQKHTVKDVNTALCYGNNKYRIPMSPVASSFTCYCDKYQHAMLLLL